MILKTEQGSFLAVTGQIPDVLDKPEFRWREVRCATGACGTDSTQWMLSGVCPHLKKLYAAGGDKEVLRHAAKQSGIYHNMVMASLLRYRMDTVAFDDRLDRSINFGVFFPQDHWLERISPNVDQREWGHLALFRPVPSGSYEKVLDLEREVVFSRPYDLTTNSVRSIGLNYLAEKFFEGLTCESPNHRISGSAGLDKSRKPADGNHRDIFALNNLAHVIVSGKCWGCQNRNAPFGLGDF